MKSTYLRSRVSFEAWVDQAPPGEEVQYSPSMMDVARELFDTDKVILYQRRLANHTFGHFAQRVSARGAGWLAHMSKLTPTPYNPHAHETAVR